MSQVHHYLALRPLSSSSSSTTSTANRIFLPTFNYQHLPQLTVTSKFHVFPAISLSASHFHHPHSPLFTSRLRLFCKPTPQLELEKPLETRNRKPEKRTNAIIWIILLNLVMYVADHILLIPDIKALYLIHNRPALYQFVTAAFCHANWNHLYSNLFFLYIFGKLVEAEKGSFALWLSYFLTSTGANLASWWLLPSNAVTIGSSGALFGLFAIGVVLKVSMDWRRKLEVLMLGQFVIVKVQNSNYGGNRVRELGLRFRGSKGVQKSIFVLTELHTRGYPHTRPGIHSILSICFIKKLMRKSPSRTRPGIPYPIG